MYTSPPKEQPSETVRINQPILNVVARRVIRDAVYLRREEDKATLQEEQYAVHPRLSHLLFMSSSGVPPGQVHVRATNWLGSRGPVSYTHLTLPTIYSV